MKTTEERMLERRARDLANLTGPRTGYIPKTNEEPTTPSPVVQGLKLSEVYDWPLERFKPHPSNHVFDSAKTEAYWRDLRRDILEAGAIINPVITLPDGTLLEGHSRIRIARELKEQGHDLGKIPVRIVASFISPEEAERRVYLGNLSRFELDDDTRLALYTKVWPDYFGQEGKAGRPEKSDHGDPITAKEIGKQIGKSEPQVKRDRAVVVRAKRIATRKGKPAPEAEDIREAREGAAAKRRAKTKTATKTYPDRVTLQLPRGHVLLVLRVMRRVKPPRPAQTAVIQEIEKALGI